MDSHNVTVDTFSQTPVTPNTKGENENSIFTSEKRDKSDALTETLNNLTINNDRYYESDSANVNDAKGDPASDLKVATHTIERNKRKVTDTSNGDLRKKILSNQTLPIITETIDPQIDNMVETYGETFHALATTTKKGVITDAAHSSARVLWTPGHVIRTVRDGTTSCDCNVFVRPPRMNSPVLIGDNTVSLAYNIVEGLEILSKHGSTGSVKIRDTQNFDTSIDGNLAKDGDSMNIFSKLIS